MTALLEVFDLVKTYGEQPAVNGISFAIETGCCFGLLGPNGAGKTTTIEVIEDVKPGMTGEWQVNDRASPRGRPAPPWCKSAWSSGGKC